MRFAFVGILFVVVGVPFYLGKVKPNSWSGFRTAKTLSDPEIWYAANKTMGRDLMIAGALLFAFSLAVVIVDHYHALPVQKLSFIAFIVVAIGAVVHCFWILSRL
jgi:uncharacterized membrane protein